MAFGGKHFSVSLQARLSQPDLRDVRGNLGLRIREKPRSLSWGRRTEAGG